MTEILCGATKCRHNHGGLCERHQIVLDIVSPTRWDLHCENFEVDEIDAAPYTEELRNK